MIIAVIFAFATATIQCISIQKTAVKSLAEVAQFESFPDFQYVGCYGDQFPHMVKYPRGRVKSVSECRLKAVESGDDIFALSDNGFCWTDRNGWWKPE